MCYRRMLRVRYTYHVTNKKVKEILRVENIKWSEDIARRKMRFVGYIMRGSSGGLMQVVLEGMIDGKRTRGRQRKIWGMTSRNGLHVITLGKLKDLKIKIFGGKRCTTFESRI